MKLIQDCLDPITKLERLVEPEKAKRLHVIASTAYSAVARFGAGLADWLAQPGAGNSAGLRVSPRAGDVYGSAEARAVDASRTKVPLTVVAQQGAPKRGTGGGCPDGDCAHQRELSRIQRDLHDQVGSSLAGMTMQLEVAQRSLPSDADRAVQMLGELHLTATQLLTAVREMSARRRAAREARGEEGSERSTASGRCDSITQALRQMTTRIQRATCDRLEIVLDIGEDVDTVRGEVGWAAFWIVNEALINILRHSHAQRCLVALWLAEGELHLQVEDDGVGGIGASSNSARGGAGLENMFDRAVEYDGWCIVQDASPTGVVVLAALPLAADGSSGSVPVVSGRLRGWENA